MKKTLMNLAFGLMFLTGFGILAYPTISSTVDT